MNQQTVLVAVLAAAAASLAGSALAQTDRPNPQDPPKPRVDWPELDAKGKSRVRFLLRKLESTDREKAADAERRLVEVGAGAAPTVIRQLGAKTTKNHDTLVRVLDGFVTAEHAPMLVGFATHAAEPLRRWVVGRLARAGDRAFTPVLERAQEDRSDEVRFQAALGLAALGELDALEVVFQECRADWRSRAADVAAVLERARGPDAAEWVLDHMPRDDTEAKVTGLRLLRTLAPKDYADVFSVFLDADQHAVKKAAINGLRVVVDRAEPIENLSVFQAIELAKEWKARLR